MLKLGQQTVGEDGMALYLVCYITIYDACNDRLLNTVLLHRLMARVVALLLLAVFWHTWIMKLQ